MTVRASNVLPQDGYETIRQRALEVKSFCTNLAATLLSDTTADIILGAYLSLRRLRLEMAQLATIPGIVAYAQAQENDATYAVSTEWNNLFSAIDSVLSNITNTFPKDVNGYLLERTILGDGTFSYRTFTAAQLATLRTLISNVAALIA